MMQFHCRAVELKLQVQLASEARTLIRGTAIIA